MRMTTGILLAALVALPVAARAQLPPVPAPKALPDKPKPEVCAQIYAPVCAKKEGHPKSYVNECFARMEGATDIKLGHCSPGQ